MVLEKVKSILIVIDIRIHHIMMRITTRSEPGITIG